MPEEGIIGPELAAKIAELQRLDERDRQRSLARAEAGIDTSIDPGPERMPDRWDIEGRGRPRWKIGREPQVLGPSVRGQQVTPRGIDLTQTLPPRKLTFAPRLGASPDLDEGGSLTPGPMMTALIRAGQNPGRSGEIDPESTPIQYWLSRNLPPWPRTSKRHGVTQDLVNQLSERVEADRQRYREEDRRRFIEDQERRIQEQMEGVRAQEAARQSGLSETFGSPEERARTILALTDLGR